MRIVTTGEELLKHNGRRGLVPTMGALHRGHLSLISAIRPTCDEVVVSIFVNPTQFRPGEDFEKYPRTPEHDLALCEAEGVDIVFMPIVQTMYPEGNDAVRVHVTEVGDLWEGADRPGHFDGVATVVAKLFLITDTDASVFGQKDLQQCAVIRRMTHGLGIKVDLHFAPTIREPDGLALSSRNVYLSAEERAVAPQLFGCLSAIKQQINSGNVENMESLIRSASATLDPLFSLSYLSVVNRNSMQVTDLEDRLATAIIAAKIGKTRLIDNLPVYD